MLSIGDSKVSKMYHGDTECKKAYLGDTLVLDNSIISAPKFVETTMASSVRWRDIKFLNNEFFALGTNYNNHTTDGITWASSSTVSSSTWGNQFSVAYGNNLYVTSGSNAKDMNFYSTTGKDDWQRCGNGIGSYDVLGMAYGNGVFVGTASGGSNISYSKSGKSFTYKSIPISNVKYAICFGGDKFVIIQRGSNKAAYSLDGVTWASITLPASGNFDMIAHGNGRFVAASYGGDDVIYSDDGITWKTSKMPSAQNWLVFYGGGIFIAVVYGSDLFAYSKDGVSWLTGTMPYSANWWRVAYGNGRFIAVPSAQTNKAVYALYGE